MNINTDKLQQQQQQQQQQQWQQISSSNVPISYLTRIEHFSSAHRLHNDNWDILTNQSIFGKCNTVHGHNYKLEVTVKGPIEPATGMVINITELKNIIQQSVIIPLDHRNIDQDVEYFHGNNGDQIISTSENICVFIWKQISKSLSPNIKLHRIKLHETENNVVEFFGEFC